MDIQFELIRNNSFQNYLDLVAAWRITYYREFPYLYVGKFEDEQQYLSLYKNDPFSSLFLAKHQQQIVGISLGLAFPTLEQSKEILDIDKLKAYLVQQQIPEHSLYYFGEFIVHPSFRDMGIAHHMFHYLEQFAIENHYKTACFITVDRNNKHKLKPAFYSEFDWELTGYKRTDIIVHSIYPTLLENGAIENTSNPMAFWIKHLK